MNGTTLLSILIVLLMTAAACQPGGSPDSTAREAELESLLAILESDRQAHFDTDAQRLASNLADTLIDVADGAIELQSRADVEESFTSYLAGADYQAWDDLVPPIVRMSDDLSMAWVVRKVYVERNESDGQGGLRRTRFTAAWIATYEKGPSGWKMTAVASTFAPPEGS